MKCTPIWLYTSFPLSALISVPHFWASRWIIFFNYEKYNCFFKIFETSSSAIKSGRLAPVSGVFAAFTLRHFQSQASLNVLIFLKDVHLFIIIFKFLPNWAALKNKDYIFWIVCSDSHKLNANAQGTEDHIKDLIWSQTDPVKLNETFNHRRCSLITV